MTLTRAVAVMTAAVACLTVLTTAPVHAADAPKAPVPIEDFVKPSQFRNPSLSPDGLHLVVTTTTKEADRDVPLMVIYKLADMSPVSTVRLRWFEVPLRYGWVTNKRIVIEIGREIGTLEAPVYTGEVMAMDIDGKNQEYLYGKAMYGRSKRGTFMPNDEGYGFIEHIPVDLNGSFLLREQAWRGNRSSLYQIDSMSAARKLVVDIQIPAMDFMVQNDGKPRFAHGFDESSKSVMFRRDDAKGEWVPVHDEKGITFWPIAFTPDNQSYYAVTSGKPATDGTAVSALSKRAVAGGEDKPLLTVGPGTIDLYQWGPRPRQPIGVGSRVGRPRVQYLDLENPETALHKQLSDQFPASFVNFLSFSADGEKLLFSVASDRDPGEFFLLDRKANKAQRVFAAMSWLDPARMGERRPVKFKARDGIELHGYITLPAGHTGGALPMVLMPHGGPHGIADNWFFNTDAQFLASRGYAVLQVNYRGSGGRGRDFQYSGYRQWGDAIQNDLIDGVRWAVEQKLADGARVCSYGGSFGAYSAMMTAIRAPELIKCAVGYAGVYDLAQMYTSDEVRRDKSFQNYMVRVIGQDPAELARNSPSHLADKLKVPVLLVHGEEDTRTPPEQAEAMRAALKKADKPHEWLMVPKEGHGFYAEKNRALFYQRLEAFLAKHIGR